MNIWETLGIPPTADIVTIKKAYADRAREWHPEEHPEEFKRLRNAYQTAVKWAKSGGAEKAGAGAEPPPAKWTEPQPEQPQPGERAEEEEPQPQFSYDDVSSIYQEETAEQFFREFHWIAWNPGLQNRKAVWHYFLLRPEYDDLYSHEDFWRRLLQEICAIPGWYTETLDYFAWWQGICRETDRTEQGDDGRMDAGNEQWSRKKWRCRENHIRYIPAPEEHMAILRTMRERGMDTALQDVVSAGAYLKYYEAFMKDNENWLEFQRWFVRRWWLKYWMFRVILLFIAGILVLALAVRIAVSVVKAEETRQQKEQEKAILREERERQRLEQESREQEQWRQELDERFENMQEQYRDWMEQ